MTVELKNGETYRGMLTEAEDSMNCQMKEGEKVCWIVCVTLKILPFIWIFRKDVCTSISHTITIASMRLFQCFVLLLFISTFSLLRSITAVTMTARDGRVSRLENVYLRGGNIKFIVLPELLKSAPIFKKVQIMRSKKVGDMDLNGGRGGRGGRGAAGGREGGRAGRGRGRS